MELAGAENHATVTLDAMKSQIVAGCLTSMKITCPNESAMFVPYMIQATSDSLQHVDLTFGPAASYYLGTIYEKNVMSSLEQCESLISLSLSFESLYLDRDQMTVLMNIIVKNKNLTTICISPADYAAESYGWFAKDMLQRGPKKRKLKITFCPSVYRDILGNTDHTNEDILRAAWTFPLITIEYPFRGKIDELQKCMRFLFVWGSNERMQKEDGDKKVLRKVIQLVTR